MERWLGGGGDTTLGGLVDLFGERSFALLFVVLMAVPALPLPTGGATHVFEIVAVLGALQLVAGRRQPWIPQRWRGRRVVGDGDGRFVRGLLRVIRTLERISRPRVTVVFGRRPFDAVFGLLVIAGCVAAFLAPPFSGLDTLPALGVVVMSLGVLMTDLPICVAGVAILAGGVLIEVFLGSLLVQWIGGLV